MKYWPNSRDFNKLVIKAKMHAKTYIFLKFSLLYENTIWFLALRLGRMHKTKKYFFFTFWRKPGILISDLYFYGIKIQTNIKQNLVEEYTEKLQFLKKRNFFNWAGSDSGPLYCSHATCICDTTPPASLRSKNTGDAGGEMAVALGGGPSSSFLCFSTFFFFSSSIFLFFFLSVLSSFPLLFCSFLFLPSALSLSPVFIGKK